MTATTAEHRQRMQQDASTRPYIYELDPIRIITALMVVAVHVLAFVNFRWQSQMPMQMQDATLSTINFTRNVFMFITAFTLVYVYYGKPFPLRRFWARRGLGVLLPYALWTVIYVWLNAPHTTHAAFSQTVMQDLLTGQASYQLYYILITVQFYLMFPFFLRFLRSVERFPWQTLAISFVIQWLLLFVDYHYLQTGSVRGADLLSQIVLARGNYALFYPFYFVLGGLTAIYWRRIRPLLLRYGPWSVLGIAGALLGVWGHFVFRVDLRRQPMSYVSSPIQPLTLFTTIIAIVCFGWLACRWAQRRDAAGQPPGHRYWKMLSAASFGIFLLHAAVLALVTERVLPVLPSVMPGAIRVLLIWLLAASITTVFSVLLARVPVLSWLVGRTHTSPGGVALRTWMAAVRSRLATEPAMTAMPQSVAVGRMSETGPRREQEHARRARISGRTVTPTAEKGMSR